MRNFKYTGQDEYISWIVEVHPTAENKDKPYHKPHHIFEVMMPEEFLNGELFMAENIKQQNVLENGSIKRFHFRRI